MNFDLLKARIARAGMVALLLVVAAIMLLPVYYMLVVASASDDHHLSRLWFQGFHLFDNVGTVLGDGHFLRYTFNSLVMSGAIAVLDVALSGAAGYALARLEFPGRRLLFAAVVTTLALSPVVVVIPVYVMVRWLGWLNSYQGLIVPGMVSAFGVFLVRQFALGIPRQMLDAARIDGVGELRIFLRIGMPLLRPALLTLLLLQFLAQWDNLLWPLIVANTQELWTIPVGLSGFQGEHGINYHLLTTGALISLLPPMILFAALQRYYVSGLTLGGLKG
jgi:multiple sugar transport system permease protein